MARKLTGSGNEAQEASARFEIVRSRRRSVSISVTAEDRVVVRAPLVLKQHVIEEIVREKSAWIEKKLLLWRQRSLARERVRRDEGPGTYYLGRYYPWKLQETVKRQVTVLLEPTFLQISGAELSAERITAALSKWLARQAEQVIAERVERYAQFFALRPSIVKVKVQKRKWGSCSFDNKLYFNRCCILLPPAVLDYIVVHELSHMAVKNHSKYFWQEVERVLPDYRERRDWLKHNGVSYVWPVAEIKLQDAPARADSTFTLY